MPWVYNILSNEFFNDSISLAVLAKHWYKKHNIKSRIIYLYDDKVTKGHCICITCDNSQFTSNDEVINIKPMYWINDVTKHFNYKYTLMFEKGE